MINKVLYLSFSDIKLGLIFPNELKESVYSPGFWAIQAKSKKECPNELCMNAVDNNAVVKLHVSRIDNDNYQVNTLKYGKIYLRLENIHKYYQNYVGTSHIITKDLSFFQLVPIDIPKLSDLCLNQNFFLIGEIDELL